MIKLDLKGLQCPLPVIKTKNKLEEVSNDVLEIYLDDDIPKENVIKLIKSTGHEYKVVKDEKKEKIIRVAINSDLEKEIDNNMTDDKVENTKGEVIFIAGDEMGTGNSDLGKSLMKSFLFALSESKPLPSSLIFVNKGVNLTTVNNETVQNIKKLEDLGVEVLSCGMCLDYYNLKEELKVGSVTNMYTIVEKLKSSKNTINIG